MTTNFRKASIGARTLVGRQTINDLLLGFLDSKYKRIVRSVFGSDCVFGSAYDVATGAGEFSVSGQQFCTDGIGNILQPYVLSSYFLNVPFENVLGADYDVGLRFGVFYNRTNNNTGLAINPGTGLPEYSALQEVIGEVGEPDSVLDNGGTITFVIDSLCETGVTHAGRKALVALNIPLSDDESVAIEEITVAYSGGQNKITTTGLLGQTPGQVSTDATKYKVVVLGPTVRRNTSLDIEGYVYLGSLNGGAPPIWTDAQNVVTDDLASLNIQLEELVEIETLNPSLGGRKADSTVGLIGRAGAAWNGNAYFFGGSTDFWLTADDLAESYDPSLDLWTTLAFVPVAVSMAGAVTVDNLIYHVGGAYDLFLISDKLHSYDPQTDMWTELAAMPMERMNGVFVALGQKLYYMGGQWVLFSPNPDCFVYDIQTDSWSVIASMPAAPTFPVGGVLDGKIVVYSGDDAGTTYEYDPDLDAWSTIQPMPSPTGNNALRAGYSFARDNILHVLSGGDGISGVRYHMAFTRQGGWVKMGKTPAPPIYYASTADVDGVVYVNGGEYGDGISTSFNPTTLACDIRALRAAPSEQVYTTTGKKLDVTQDFTTVTFETMPLRAARHQCAVLDRAIYFGGGIDIGMLPIKTFWVYYPDTQTYAQLADFSTERMEPGMVAVDGNIWLLGGYTALGNVTGAELWVEDANPQWNDLSSDIPLLISRFGSGGALGSSIYLPCGDQGPVPNTSADDIGVIDTVTFASGTVGNWGGLPRARCGTCLSTTAGWKTETTYSPKLWVFSGLDDANVLQTDVLIYDIQSGLKAVSPLTVLGGSSGSIRAASDGSSVVAVLGNRIQTFGAVGRNDSGTLGAVPQTHKYNSAMGLLEGVLYQIGGAAADLGAPTTRLSKFTYGGSYLFLPKNYTTGLLGQSVSANKGDIVGYFTWSDRHVYEVSITGLGPG